MPFPLLFVGVITAGVTALAGRKAHDKWADHPPLRGYCSNCGNITQHEFRESGMSWKKTGGMGVLLGAAGIGVSSILARNVYKCRGCQHLTLTCRLPGCSGMVRAGDYYDDEFCGECLAGNDNSKLYNAFQDQKTLAKVTKIIVRMQGEIEALKARLVALEKDRAGDEQLIQGLSRVLREKEQELAHLRQQVGAA